MPFTVFLFVVQNLDVVVYKLIASLGKHKDPLLIVQKAFRASKIAVKCLYEQQTKNCI